MKFNNYKDGLAHFLEEDQTKLLSSSLAGISVGLTNHALSIDGYGSFSGTDLISIPEKMCHEDWTVIINFEEEDCPPDPSKKRVLLSSKQICDTSTQGTTTTAAGTTTTAAPLDVGFSIGINGAKNLFYEYYDTDGVLKKYTMPYTLAERNIIAFSKSGT